MPAMPKSRAPRGAATLGPIGLALLLACGGGTSGPNPPPPPPPPAAPVATVEVTPSSSSVLAGTPVPLSAVTRDASGNVLTGRSLSWTSAPGTVASVSTSGVVTTIAPGDATISAVSEGKTGTATVTVVDPLRIPAFSMPFPPAEYRTSNFNDHNLPKEFIDNNGVYLSWWGENSAVGIDGHQGYDWQMDTGTPILAVAPGTVVAAGNSPQFFCPILNQTVSNPRIIIEHSLPGGVRVRSASLHLSRIDVTLNQTVTEGQQIGLSGGEGCSLSPHLHFDVFRVTQTKTGQPTTIDPYGWDGAGADPWAAHPEGAVSINLWKVGQAPALFRNVRLPLNPDPGDNLFVAMTRVRFQGVRDELNPNNEYVEITRDNRFAPATLDLSGFTIRNKAGDIFTFPAGFTLTTARTVVKVFTGSGTNTLTELYWGQPSGRWNNSSECVRFFNAAGVIRNQASIAGGCA
jgi:murein DD-endopeptidase MepM/ murein hydrolase activator NlpD